MRTRIIAALVLAASVAAVRPAPAQPAAAPRGFVSVNAGAQSTSTSFLEPLASVLYLETESIAPSYGVGSGFAFDAGGGLRIWKSIGAAVTVSSFATRHDASVAASLPHPFFYGAMRSVSGTAPGVERRELATHIQAVAFVPAGRRFDLMISGGPSVFSVKQGIVTGIAFTETYPYDTATFGAATVEAQTKTVWGMNAGADAVFRVAGHVGVGGSLRYSHARVSFPVRNAAQATSADVGGLQVGGGLRLLF